MLKKIASIPFRFRLMAEIAVVALIIAGYYFMFLVPLQDEQSRLEQEYDDLVYRINDVRPYALSYDDFRKQLAMMEEQLAIVVQALPDEKGYYLLYDEAVGLAEKDGVRVTLFQPGGERRIDDFHSSVNFNVRLESSYGNFVKYLYDLNYLNKMINLQDMDIRVLNSPGGEKILAVNANLNSYRFNASAAASADNSNTNRRSTTRSGGSQ